MDVANEITGQLTVQPDEGTTSTPKKSAFRKVAWGFFFVFLVLVFTLLKLPDTRIRALVQSSINSALAEQGYSLSSEESELSLIFGPAYELKRVAVYPPSPGAPIKLDRIKVSPSLLSLLKGMPGASFVIEKGKGSLSGTGAAKGDEFSISFDADGLDAGALGILEMAGGIKGSLLLDGKGSVSGKLSSPTAWTGSIAVDLKKINLPAQSIKGFSVPNLEISEGKLDLGIDKGKILMKTVKLGKTGSTTDDLVGTVSGDVTLGPQLDASTMNLKTTFSFSKKVQQAFLLLDALLARGKQPDGSYSYTLTGPASFPNFQPAGGQP